MSAAPQKPFDPSDELDWPDIGELVEALREIVAAHSVEDETDEIDVRRAAALSAGRDLLTRIDQAMQEAFPHAR